MSLLRREQFSQAVNGLTNNPKILHITKTEFFKLNCHHRHEEIWLSCCRSALNSVWPQLSSYFSKDPLKHDFLNIYLTMFFGIRKFKKTSAKGVIFFLKIFKTESKFRNFFVSEIIASQEEDNTCHRQSVGQQNVVIFCISLTETFSNLIVFRKINKYGKGVVVQL